MPITTGVKTPIRSRTFTERDAKDAHAALTAYVEQGKTDEGVGYGLFPSAEAARSAGQTLNKIIAALGLRSTKWATGTFPVDVDVDAEGNVVPDLADDADEDAQTERAAKVTGTARKFQGVMLPKDAKPAPTPAKKSSGRGRKASS